MSRLTAPGLLYGQGTHFRVLCSPDAILHATFNVSGNFDHLDCATSREEVLR